MTPHEKIKFDALRNAIYHASRRRFFELLSRFLSFLIVVSGTAAVANLQFLEPRLLAALAAVIGAAQLVFDFNGRARIHENLQQKYYELISQIEKISKPSEDDCSLWRASLADIYKTEPPPMRALDSIAYNAACDSLGCGDHRVRVTFPQWLFSQIYAFPDTEFPYVKATSVSSAANSAQT